MINVDNNPSFLNSFLDYTATILNKSPNTIKEYNYDLNNFLKFILVHFKMVNTKDIKEVDIHDMQLSTIEKIKLEDIHAYLFYLKNNFQSKAATRARKVASIRVFFNYLCNKANLIEKNPAQNLETPKQEKRTAVSGSDICLMKDTVNIWQANGRQKIRCSQQEVSTDPIHP